MKTHWLEGTQCNVAESALNRWSHGWAKPCFIEHLFFGDHPGHVTEFGRRRVGHRCNVAGAAVQPAEAAFARLHRDRTQQFIRRMQYPFAHINLAVVGRDDHGGTGRQRPDQFGDQQVGEAQLGVVEGAEATLVGDLVDAVVVAVHETLTCCDLSGGFDSDARWRPPANGVTAAQVGLAESRLLCDHRNPFAKEWLERLDLARWVRAPNLLIADRPAEHVHHFAAECHPIPDEAMFSRGEPRGDRAQGRCSGGGCDRVDRLTLHRHHRRGEVRMVLELVPTETIDHQHDDRIGGPHGVRHPVREGVGP